jgi:hypothetical protein
MTPTPASVGMDVDGDGNGEEAVDADGDPANGYEEYRDTDGSSFPVESLDGDGDGKTDFLVSTDADGVPEVYWDPDGGILTQVDILDADGDGDDDWVIDTDGDGTADKYIDPENGSMYDYTPPTATPTVTPTNTPAPPTATPTLTPVSPTVTPEPTVAPFESTANYLELSVENGHTHPGGTVTMRWRIDPDMAWGMMNRPVAIYFGVAEGSASPDRPATVDEALRNRRMYMFETEKNELVAVPMNPQSIPPTWPQVTFPLAGGETSGTMEFAVPTDPSFLNTDWVFEAAFIDLRTGRFVNERFPVEISNAAPIR